MDATVRLKPKPIKKYFLLTKPGIIAGNAITAAGGFAFAAAGRLDWALLLTTLLGLSFVIASACVFNNYIDRAHDKLMARTQKRPLATGAISIKNALLFAAILGLCGFTLLTFFSTLLATSIAFLGFITYVLVYSKTKYHSTQATLIGSISGAAPPLAGYCACSNTLDLAALIVLMMMILWQMPHFFAISLFRLEDYKAASIPTLSVTKGVMATKMQMLIYTVAFAAASLMPTLFGYTGYGYLTIASLLGSYWIVLALQGFKCENTRLWARKMFFYSLVVVIILFASLAIAH